MKAFGAIVASLVVASILANGAHASEPITYGTSVGGSIGVADTPHFDWSGFYAGIYGVGKVTSDHSGQYGLGIDAGVNGVFDFYLLGAEASLEGTIGQGGSGYGAVLGRAGVLLTDNALAYGAAGYGLDLGAANESDILAGGGLEYALTPEVSVRAQYLHGFPVNGDNAKNQVSLGAQFHF